MTRTLDSAPVSALTVLPYLETTGSQVRLVATHCPDCGFNTFPPSTVCPRCMSLAVLPLPLSRTGTLYSYTTIRHARKEAWGGYVDFPENIRVFGHLGGFSADAPPRCDMAVQVVPAAPVEGATSAALVDFNFIAAAAAGAPA
ncbi:MAG: zinc ribbon domain-containing protein [Pseudomonadota bacterium]